MWGKMCTLSSRLYDVRRDSLSLRHMHVLYSRGVYVTPANGVNVIPATQ